MYIINSIIIQINNAINYIIYFNTYKIIIVYNN